MIHLILDPLLIEFGTSLQTKTHLHWISPAWLTNTHLCGHPPEVNGPFGRDRHQPGSLGVPLQNLGQGILVVHVRIFIHEVMLCLCLCPGGVVAHLNVAHWHWWIYPLHSL